MLLSNDVARGIADGTISLVFRRWRRPDVAAGDTLRTVAGVVAIDSVTAIDPSEISEDAAAASGAESPAELLSSLHGSSDQTLYRIAVRRHGSDPRDVLRAESTLSHELVDQMSQRLANLDQRSRHGAWTHATLRQILDCPGRPASELAESLGRDKEPSSSICASSRISASPAAFRLVIVSRHEGPRASLRSTHRASGRVRRWAPDAGHAHHEWVER